MEQYEGTTWLRGALLVVVQIILKTSVENFSGIISFGENFRCFFSIRGIGRISLFLKYSI